MKIQKIIPTVVQADECSEKSVGWGNTEQTLKVDIYIYIYIFF